MYVKTGAISIVDASVIQAQRSAIARKKIKHGNNTQEPEAGCNVKIGTDGKPKTTYWFKAHMDADGFVQAMEFTSDSVHDSQVFTELLSGDEEKIFTVSAYASEKTNAWLAEKSIVNVCWTALIATRH